MDQDEEHPGGQAGASDWICALLNGGHLTTHGTGRKASFRIGPLSHRGEKKWALVVNGDVIVLTTSQFMAGPNGRAFREKAFEQLEPKTRGLNGPTLIQIERRRLTPG